MEAMASELRWFLYGLLLLISFACLLLAWRILTSILTPFGVLSRQMARVAKGITAQEPAEIQEILAAFRGRRDELRALGDGLYEMQKTLEARGAEAHRLSGGDLTLQPTPICDGDTLGNAFRRLVSRLRQTITQVGQVAANVEAGATQISQASQQLSQGASEQAAAIEEIGASLRELAQQSKANTEAVRQAHEGTALASQEAKSGQAQMNNSVQAMA